MTAPPTPDPTTPAGADARPRVAGYLRQSGVLFPAGCDGPGERRGHVDRQRRVRMAELAADAARHGDVIMAWYDDMGVSARGEFRDRRDGFGRLCRDARDGRVRRVYARDLSRLFRDLVQQELWFAEMEAAGVEVLAADLPGGDPATRRLLRQQLGAIHEYLSARSGALMGAMLRERVRQGLWVGRQRDAWGLRYNPATKGFAPDPDTAGRARAVFEAFNASGGLPTAAACRLNRMTDEGHPRATGARWGGRWTQEQVRRFVTNPLYRRATLYGGVWVALPALIPEAVPAALVAETDRLLALSARDRGLVEAQLKAYAAPADLPPSWRPVASTYASLLRCGDCGGLLAPHYHASRHGSAAPGRYSSWLCYAPADAHPPDASGRATVHSARLDALVGRAVREALGLYGLRAGFGIPAAGPRLPPPQIDAPPIPAGGAEAREARWEELRAAGMAAGPAPVARAAGPPPREPTGPPRRGPLCAAEWEEARGRAEGLWPEADWRDEAAWGALWERPLLEGGKRALLCGLGAVLSVRVLPPDPPLPRLRRNLSQCGGRLLVRLDCPALGCGGDDAHDLEEWPGERRAFRRWQCRGDDPEGVRPRSRGGVPDSRDSGPSRG